jgi:hypothetical protein
LEDLTVGRGSDESDGLPERIQGLDSRFAARRHEVIGVVRQSDSGELLFDCFGGSGRVGDQRDAPAFIAPLAEAIGRSRIKCHAVVHDSPDVAEDQAIFGIERIE